MVVGILIDFLHMSAYQGDDRRSHSADPGSANRPHRASGGSPSISAQHHPLHRCGLYPAVHVRDCGSHCFGTGSIQRQVRNTLILFDSVFPHAACRLMEWVFRGGKWIETCCSLEDLLPDRKVWLCVFVCCSCVVFACVCTPVHVEAEMDAGCLPRSLST